MALILQYSSELAVAEEDSKTSPIPTQSNPLKTTSNSSPNQQTQREQQRNQERIRKQTNPENKTPKKNRDKQKKNRKEAQKRENDQTFSASELGAFEPGLSAQELEESS